MRLDAIPIGANPPEEVNVIIEVPIGGEPIKYELDKDSGTLFVDRFLAIKPTLVVKITGPNDVKARLFYAAGEFVIGRC